MKRLDILLRMNERSYAEIVQQHHNACRRSLRAAFFWFACFLVFLAIYLLAT